MAEYPICQYPEIQEFLVSDNLGVIANAHVVHAGRDPDMAHNPKRLELAQLASMAVDFLKTGVPAVIPKELRPREYPDFMEKAQSTTYTSHDILGKLHRSTNPIGIGFALGEEEMKKCYDTSLIVPDYKNQLESALADKKLYNTKLMGLMNQFGIREEAEIVSVRVLTMSELYMRRPVDTLPKVRLAFKGLQNEAKLWCIGDQSRQVDPEEVAKASAWYHVTYHYSYFSHKDHS